MINSPGGSAVQSCLIAARIRRLADEKKVPVHAFVEDVAASGGYWLACAADDIWVDDSSIVGSIGVIFASFGFPELMARQGVERRVDHGGQVEKPCRPVPAAEARGCGAAEGAAGRRSIEAFIAHVKARRGARLDRGADLFNADIWVGQAGGRPGAGRWRGASGAEAEGSFTATRCGWCPMASSRSLFQRLGLRGSTGAALAAVEDRALWARYGL